MSGYSPLLAKAASTLSAQHDIVSDGLSAGEKKLLDVADSRLFGNPAFLASTWGPDRWPVEVHGFMQASSVQTPGGLLSDEEIRLASARAIIALMQEIDVEKKANGHHLVSWEVDGLDRVLDDLGVYPGLCIHCYGKTGYDTRDGLDENYGVIIEQGHVHREMLKAFAYFAKADGEGILVRSFLQNEAEDFDVLYKRRLDRFPSVISLGSFAYENVSFMSQIRLPDGDLVSYPTMAFRMAGDARTERDAVERVYDYMRKALTHSTGDLENFANLYRPHTVTPYSPQLGWVVYVEEAGSPSASAVVTGALRALGLGLGAEQFRSPKNFRAGSVEVDGETYYYDGNAFTGEESDLCNFFQTLEEVETLHYCPG